MQWIAVNLSSLSIIKSFSALAGLIENITLLSQWYKFTWVYDAVICYILLTQIIKMIMTVIHSSGNKRHGTQNEVKFKRLIKEFGKF